MSARADVAQHLRTKLPTDYLITGANVPEVVTRPTVALWVDSLEPLPAAPDGGRQYAVDLVLWVLVGTEDIDKADDQLDDALDQVLAAINDLGDGLWTRAERLPFDQTTHGYKVTASAVGQNGA